MIEDNARIPINMTEPVDLNLKMEAYTIIGDADAIYNQGYSAGFAKGEEQGFDNGYKAGEEDGILKGDEQGFNRGYEQGKGDGIEEGKLIGYEDGFSEGLAQRTFETWTFTLADGSTVEKKVALI